MNKHIDLFSSVGTEGLGFAHIWSQNGHMTKTSVIPGSDSMYGTYFGSVEHLLHANAFVCVTS